MASSETQPDFDFERHRIKAIDEYQLVRSQYSEYAEVVRSILRVAIPASCPIHSVEARAKAIDRFGDKAAKPSPDDPSMPRYPEPLKDITDLAGARVITFFPRDLERVCGSIEEEFIVVDRLDKGEELVAEERFGYQSIHYIVKLKASRSGLPEYQRFSDLVAEIQVRTILQHAWAEMEHDIQYKSAATIPAETRRRFMSLAGMLEIADREFQAIQDEDSQLREDFRRSLEEDFSAQTELRSAAATPEENLETKEGKAATEQRYIPGSARVLLASGYYQEAVRAYTEVIRRYPTVHTNYLGRARAHFLSGDTAKALDDVATAWTLYPDDPQILRLREQIEEGRVRAATPRASAAQGEVVVGFEKLKEGAAGEAMTHFLEAERLGWYFAFAQFNQAMAMTLGGEIDDVLELLDELEPDEDTFMSVNIAALRAVCVLIAERPSENLLDDLRERLLSIDEFEFDRSPLRFLEQGLESAQPDWHTRATAVFGLLQRGGELAG